MTSDNESSAMLERLQYAEAENVRLKTDREYLRLKVMELNEQLEDANNEISRLCMVLKHREMNVQHNRRLHRLNEFMLATAASQ